MTDSIETAEREALEPPTAGAVQAAIKLTSSSYRHSTQVGGTHYDQGNKPQHWDLVLMYDWDYFQGQVIKYLMRWKTKYKDPWTRLEDLKKARNFLDKYVLEEERKLAMPNGLTPVQTQQAVDAKTMFSDFGLVRAGESMLNGPAVTVMPDGPLKAEFDDGTILYADSNIYFQCEGWYGDRTQLYTCRACHKTVRTKSLEAAKSLHLCQVR